MTKEFTAETAEVDALVKKLTEEAEEGGYQINPNMDETRELVEGLVINKKRYGYLASPCRLASGNKADDLDIVCPCDYRDPDLDEYGACYCNLYVYDKTPEMKPGPVPERRPAAGRKASGGKEADATEKSLPVWVCKVCGYLCARENPPAKCPVCKVGRERFRKYMG